MEIYVTKQNGCLCVSEWVWVWANEWEKVNDLIRSFWINFHKYAHRTLTLITFCIQSKRFRCNALSHCLYLSLSLLYFVWCFKQMIRAFAAMQTHSLTLTKKAHIDYELDTLCFALCVTPFSTTSVSPSSILFVPLFSDKNFTIGIWTVCILLRIKSHVSEP